MNKNKSTAESTLAPVFIADPQKYWLVSIIAGVILWLIGLLLWRQQEIDKTILFFFNPARIASDPIIVLSQYLSSYGLAAITVLLILYHLFSRKFPNFDAPATVYFYTLCSFGLSGIAGDLLKFVFARPRPAVTFGAEILAWSDSLGYAIPSGHATKTVALCLPFLLLASSSKQINRGVKVVIFLIAGGVCFSRIALGAHYLSDVLAGIGTAVMGFPLTLLFARMVLKKVDPNKLPKLTLVWVFLLVVLTAIFMAI